MPLPSVLTVAGRLGLRGRSRFLADTARRILDRFGGRMEQVWSLGIYVCDSPFTLKPAPGAANPILTAADVTDMDASFLADPFMVRTEDGWCMFFEVIDAGTGRGSIAYASSADGLAWEYGSVVLTEPFHLSYPFVFEHEGEMYMVPETVEADGVFLYKAADFPRGWERTATLLTGRWADASLVEHEGRWWMFASDDDGPTNANLHLFHAEELLGPWEEHRASPLVANQARIARPAGRPVVVDGSLVRFAQDCVPDYGMRVHAFKIHELTRDLYREDRVPAVALDGSGEGWNAEGMHHVDPHQLDDGTWIAAVDGWRW